MKSFNTYNVPNEEEGHYYSYFINTEPEPQSIQVI